MVACGSSPVHGAEGGSNPHGSCRPPILEAVASAIPPLTKSNSISEIIVVLETKGTVRLNHDIEQRSLHEPDRCSSGGSLSVDVRGTKSRVAQLRRKPNRKPSSNPAGGAILSSASPHQIVAGLWVSTPTCWRVACFDALEDLAERATVQRAPGHSEGLLRAGHSPLDQQIAKKPSRGSGAVCPVGSTGIWLSSQTIVLAMPASSNPHIPFA